MWLLSSWKPLSAVLSQKEAVSHVASAYIDDIYVNKDVIPVTRVREHLARFGLECKDPERLKDGTWVLRLAVVMEHGKLWWKWGTMVLDALDIVTRRAVFSLCGRLVWHFQVCGWLCVACRVLKRRASSVKTRDNLLQHMISVDSVQWDDPALSNQSSIGETQNSAWGCLLAVTWKRRPTY